MIVLKYSVEMYDMRIRYILYSSYFSRELFGCVILCCQKPTIFVHYMLYFMITAVISSLFNIL